MTPEERARQVAESWVAEDSELLDYVTESVTAAIRRAVEEERERFLKTVAEQIEKEVDVCCRLALDAVLDVLEQGSDDLSRRCAELGAQAAALKSALGEAETEGCHPPCLGGYGDSEECICGGRERIKRRKQALASDAGREMLERHRMEIQCLQHQLNTTNDKGAEFVKADRAAMELARSALMRAWGWAAEGEHPPSLLVGEETKEAFRVRVSRALDALDERLRGG